MPEERILGMREIEADDFANYRQVYPGRRCSNHTWKHRLESFARVFPDRAAMIQGDRTFSWREFNARCNRLAHGMLALGIGREERVAIMGFNSIEWMEIFFAASKIGAVPANVNPRFIPDEIAYVLEDCDASIVFVEEPYVGTLASIRPGLPSLRQVVVYGVGQPPVNVPEDALAYEGVMSTNESNPQVAVYNDDFSFLMYTGGTTGYPKGTVWDGEQRVRGLDMMLINNIVPIFDRLAEFPDEVMQGVSLLLTSSAKGVDVLSRILRTKVARKVLRSPLTKNLLFNTFNAIAGNAWALKVLGHFQREGVRLLCAAPLFHGAGVEGCFTYLGAISSCTVFLPTPHPFIPREFLEAVEKHRVHTAVIVGDAFALPLVEELRKADTEGRSYRLGSLWGMVSSGVRWSPHVKQELLQHMPGLLVVDTMGTSESSGAFAAITASSDSRMRNAGAQLVTDKSGFLAKQVFPARVVSPETGRDVTPGSDEIGEFLFGGWMTLGYWKCPRKTGSDFRVIDGKRWFFAGDEGTVSEDGRFNLIGRGGGYMINSGGEKVYSEEVEEIVKSHPKVWDVAVIGLPDPRWGQAVTALVQPAPGEALVEDEIKEFCGEHMAGYKRPRRVFIVEEVPRSASGKINRAAALSLIGERME